MMQKRNQLIMLIVLVTFMFTIVGSAGAASFSDVTGTSDEAAAVYRLNGLGIIDGYPDGTFGPEKTITRAEFAKIACVTAGLKSVASGMSGTASSFSDVAADHWANGWINVVAAQGFVKGDPNGTFRPEDQITQAEVVTVLLRLLGYNDNLPGNWPSDYIAKAANLGILDDVTFVSDQAATRGLVAVVTSATLDENVVEYAASDNIFNEAIRNGGTYTLLADSFKSTSTADPVLVYDLDLSGGERAIKIVAPSLTDANDIKNAIDKSIFVSYKLADDCVISGAASFLGVNAHFVKYTLNDDDEIMYIEVKNDDEYQVIAGISPSDIQRVDGNTIKIKDGKSYDIASDFDTRSSGSPGAIYTTSGFTSGTANYTRLPKSGFLGSDRTAVTINGKATGGYQSAANGDYLDDYLEGVNMQSEAVDLVLNDDGDIAYMAFNSWPTAPSITMYGINNVGIIDAVNTRTGKVSLKNGGSFTFDADDPDNQYIVRNGKVSALDDLAENDMVWYMSKFNTNFVMDMAVTASATLESYEDTTFLGAQYAKKVIVGDKTYDVIKGGGFISTDDGDTYSKITGDFDNKIETPDTIVDDLEDATGGDVIVYLSPSGTVAAILVGEGGVSSSLYGVINDDAVSSLVEGKVTASIEVMLADGSLTTYAPDEDSEIEVNGAKARDLVAADITGTNLDVDDLVQITLNSDGYINVIKTGSSIKYYKNFGNVAINGDQDEMTITIGGNSYDLGNAVVFNTCLSIANKDDDEVDTVSLSEFMDNADSGIAKSGNDVVAVVNDGTIKYLVFDDPKVLGSDNKLAMVTSKGTDSNGAYVKLMTTGDPVKYTIKSVNGVYYSKGKVINYDLVSGKVKMLDWSNWNQYGDSGNLVIDKISGKVFTITDTKGTDPTTDDVTVSYAVDADTLYFDYTDDDPVVAEKGDFATDDRVLIYQEKSGDALAAIVLVD
ncbi:MAG TPA: S-layer homology domain-containing protein [Syntrophomonas sp.]|nr:S-layer homology domain-containing protein [Syntrophomonas sp.]